MAAYIDSFAQISTQSPLDCGFFMSPVPCESAYCRAVEADYTKFIPPIAARRMGALLKRALATSITALKEAGIDSPEAIIFGTGLGCIDNTEKFLSAMIDNAETCLQPTFFINSTHNTIASQVATFLKCNSYNSTYAHLGVSFEGALMDALMQIELGAIGNALVGAHDEMTPTYYGLFKKVDYWKSTLGECSATFVISSGRKPSSLCEFADMDLIYSPSQDALKARLERLLAKNGISFENIDAIVTGRNGDERYDGGYDEFVEGIFGKDKFQCHYKHIFGESFSSSAFGLMLGAKMLSEGSVPQDYVFSGSAPKELNNILVVNSFHNNDWSFMLLRK